AASLRHDALSWMQSFNHGIKPVRLSADANWSYEKLVRLLGCDKHNLLIVNRLDRIFRDHRHRFLGHTERAECDVNEHANLEYLTRIRQFDSDLSGARRRIDLRIDVRHAPAKQLPRISVSTYVRPTADTHRRKVLFVNLSDDPNGRQICHAHQFFVR